MKSYSNIQLPTEPQRWCDGQTVRYFNHKDNGVQKEGVGGMRYEAEMLVMKDNEKFEASLLKYYADPVLSEAIKDNIEIEGVKAIEITKDYKPSSAILTRIDAVLTRILPVKEDLKA